MAIRRSRRSGRAGSLLAVAIAVALDPSAARADEGGPPVSDAPPDAAEVTPPEQPKPMRFDGPMELQDTFLPAQLRYQSFPESAETLRVGEWAARLVADWSNHLAQTDTYLFDGESVTNTLRVRYAPLRHLEFGVDVPYTVRFDGTLDSFIEQVEESLNAQVDARFLLPRDRYFAFVVDENHRGPILIEPEDNGLGDISLRVKGQVLEDGPLGLDAAINFALALPTGQTSFGGDGVSPSLGLHLQRRFEYLNPFAGAAITYYSDARADELKLAPYRTMAYTGLEWRPWHWLGLVVEAQFYTALARTNPTLNHPAYYYAGAFRFYPTDHMILELGAVENLGLIDNKNSTDVTFKGSLGVRF